MLGVAMGLSSRHRFTLLPYRMLHHRLRFHQGFCLGAGTRAENFPSETLRKENLRGLYDGPFRWENMFGFHLAGMVGHDFFKPYAVSFDFQNMQIFLQ